MKTLQHPLQLAQSKRKKRVGLRQYKTYETRGKNAKWELRIALLFYKGICHKLKSKCQFLRLIFLG